MRTSILSCYVVAALLVSGCATMSPSIYSNSKEINGEWWNVVNAEAQEKTEPGDARKAYERLLESEATLLPREKYEAQLRDDLTKLTQDDSAVIDKNDVSAFPHMFERRLEIVCRAHRGLARLDLAAGDFASAESHVAQAKKALDDNPQTATFAARQYLENFKLLVTIDQRAGKPGKAAYAKLNAGTVAAYLSSTEAAQDFYAEKGTLELAEGKVSEVDSFITDVNAVRQAKADAQLAQLNGALMQMGSMANSMAINQRLAQTHGRVTPDVRQLQANQTMINTQIQFQSSNPYFAKGAGQVDMFFSPFKGLLLSHQLSEPSTGPQADAVVSQFVTAVGQLLAPSGDKSESDDVSKKLGDVQAARSQGNTAQIADSVTSLVTAIQQLQPKVEKVSAR